MREIKGDWRDLFHCFRMALDLRKLSLAFVGIVFSVVGIALVLTLTLLASHLRGDNRALWEDMKAGHWGDVRVRVGAFGHDVFELRQQGAGEVSVMSSCPGCARLCKAFSRCPLARCPLMRCCCGGHPTKAGCILYALCGAWLLAVWAFFGGAITRIAAVELAKDERIEFNEATRFAKARYWSYVWSPLSVAAAALVFGLCVVAGAWLCDLTWNIGVGKILMVLGLPLALLGGFLIVLLAIGGLLGCCMMFPAVSTEGTDAFDAVSRAFSYVFSRPWRYLWYHLVAFVYAIPSCLFIFVFTGAFMRLTMRLICLGSPHLKERFGTVLAAQGPALGGSFAWVDFSQGPLLWMATCLVFAMLFTLWGLAIAYPVSYVWTARTTIYFLMRKAVDGTEMKEVYEEESEEDLVAGGSAPPAPPEAPKTV